MSLHKTFISYHHKNEQKLKDKIIEEYGGEDFIDKSVSDGDIDPNLEDTTIMSKIRNDFLGMSTVTLVLIGRETAQRPFVNSEIQASLWGSNPNGLVAVVDDQLYDELYSLGTCNGDNCNCSIRFPVTTLYDKYLPELVRRNREIDRNKDFDLNRCHFDDSEVYCSLTNFSSFIGDAKSYIDKAFDKRNNLNYEIAKKLSNETPKIQKNAYTTLRF